MSCKELPQPSDVLWEMIPNLRGILEGAPPASAIKPSVAGLLGFAYQGIDICATCAGRIMARGVSLPHAEPLWDDEYMNLTCSLCGGKGK
jgi:hypothetical protein